MHVRVVAAGEQYAIPARLVLEVAKLGAMTPVPGAPAAVLGISNIRGQVIPVVDLAALLGLGRDRAEDPVRIVLVADGERRAALTVDSLVDVGPLPDATEDAESVLLAGAAMVDGVLVGMVDVGAVLDEATAEVTR